MDKSGPGGRNSKCKGPEAGAWQECLKASKDTSQSQYPPEDVRRRMTLCPVISTTLYSSRKGSFRFKGDSDGLFWIFSIPQFTSTSIYLQVVISSVISFLL